MRLFIICLAAILWSANAHAVLQQSIFNLFSDPDPNGAFAGMTPGADLRWGTADDVAVPGLNTAGHAWYFRFDDPLGDFFGFGGGTLTTLQESTSTAFDVLDAGFAATVNCLICTPTTVGMPTFSQVSGPGSVNAGSVMADQTFEFSNTLLSSDGDTSRLDATGWLLFAGQTPSDVPSFDSGVVSHFDTVLASGALAADWVLLSFYDFTFEIFDGPSTGVTGFGTVTTVLTPDNFSVVPIPAAAYLFGSALAMMGLRGRRPV